jgi:LmbE family N-acetylglucosaminyl deacetylase
VETHILKLKPDVVVTYPQHGISGHFDHLAIHAVVKYLYAKMRRSPLNNFWKRLAFFTLGEPDVGIGNPNATFSAPAHIDCVVPLDADDIEMLKKTLHCYKSYEEVIVNYDVVNHIGNKVHFEFWDENFEPPLADITANLRTPNSA